MLDTVQFASAVADVNTSFSGSEDARRDKIAALTAQWQEYLVEENDIAHLSDETKSRVYALAYRFGMSSGYGYDEVENYYRELAAAARDAA